MIYLNFSHKNVLGICSTARQVFALLVPLQRRRVVAFVVLLLVAPSLSRLSCAADPLAWYAYGDDDHQQSYPALPMPPAAPDPGIAIDLTESTPEVRAIAGANNLEFLFFL